MCDFCSGEHVIRKEPPLYEKIHTAVEVHYDEEEPRLLKVRMEFGSAGYTLPIFTNYCMYCGQKLGGDSSGATESSGS